MFSRHLFSGNINRGVIFLKKESSGGVTFQEKSVGWSYRHFAQNDKEYVGFQRFRLRARRNFCSRALFFPGNTTRGVTFMKKGHPAGTFPSTFAPPGNQPRQIAQIPCISLGLQAFLSRPIGFLPVGPRRGGVNVEVGSCSRRANIESRTRSHSHSHRLEISHEK